MDNYTIAQRVQNKARTDPDRVAIRTKDRGVWQEMNWREYADLIRRFALGLARLGLESSDRLMVIGENAPQWLVADVAAQSLSAMTVGLFAECTSDEVAGFIKNSEPRVVVAQGQEQVDKLLENRKELPAVEKVVYWEPRGLRGIQDPWLASFNDVISMGDELHMEDEARFDRELARGEPSNPCAIMYTSGTTAEAKGAVVTAQAMTSAVEQFGEPLRLDNTFELLCHLPLAWMAERYFAVAGHSLYGYTLNFPESPETVQENIREVGPNLLVAPPRVWEEYATTIQIRSDDATWLKRTLLKWFSPERLAQGKTAKLKGPLAEFLVHRPIRDHLGLLNARALITGGGALGSDLLSYFHSIGLPLRQAYGSTEGGNLTVHQSTPPNPETMGRPNPGVDIRIAEDGEILVKAASLFSHYWRDEGATSKAFVDGWFRTGDAGFITDSGELVVSDRLKDFFTLSNGARFAPQMIETKLKFSRYLFDACVFGEGHDFVTALIVAERENVTKWAERKGLNFVTYEDLTQTAEILELVAKEVSRVNSTLSPHQRIVSFCVLHREFDPDEGEVTRTRKLRRGMIADRYSTVIEALYSGRDVARLVGSVNYRDGTSVTRELDLRVIPLETRSEDQSDFISEALPEGA